VTKSRDGRSIEINSRKTWRKRERERELEDLDVDGRIILECTRIFEKWVGRFWTVFI
jgi:hypothetical protein